MAEAERSPLMPYFRVRISERGQQHDEVKLDLAEEILNDKFSSHIELPIWATRPAAGGYRMGSSQPDS